MISFPQSKTQSSVYRVYDFVSEATAFFFQGRALDVYSVNGHRPLARLHRSQQNPAGSCNSRTSVVVAYVKNLWW